MKKLTGNAICLLIVLHAPFARAQTAAPHPNLETADWSIKQAQSLNAEPKKAVWEFIDNLLGLGLGKLCSFEFADLRHSGELSLVVSYDTGGTMDCNDVEVFDRTAAGIEAYDFNTAGASFFDSIEDSNGDDNRELVVDRSFAAGGIDHCTATWPVIYAWNGTGYADVSGQFKSFYRQRLQELNRQLAPSPTPTAVSKQYHMARGLPLEGTGPQLRGEVIRPPPSAPSESASAQEASDTGDRDCLKAEAAKIERFLGISSDAGMLDAIRWNNSDNANDREFAASVLYDIATPEAMEDLRTLSKDPDPNVASTGKEQLTDITMPRVGPTIQGELLTKDIGTPSAK